jgi:hypothetical protein
LTAPALNIYQKVSAITEAIGLIGKDANAPQQMGGYAFTSHGALLGHIRHELTSRNVVIRPSGEELLKADVLEKRVPTYQNGQIVSEKVSHNYHSIIKYRFTVVNGDDPTDFFEDFWIGEGMDTSDKGIQKAGTSAEKYYLMKLFKVGDKDDPDGLTVDNQERVVSQSAQIAPPPTKESAEQIARPAGSPGAFSYRATGIENPTKLETLVADAGLSKDENQSEDSPEEAKNKLEALVWLGEQLPPATGWFRGKIVALVSLWDVKEKNKTNTPEDSQAGSAINFIFNQLAAAHKANCNPPDGAWCEHMMVPKLAILTGGRIVDPAINEDNRTNL